MKNPTVKKIFACVAVLTVLTGSAQGAYKVEIDDDTYVSDEVYFAPVSTWDEVKAQRINLKQGKVLFYAGKENEPYKIAAEVMPLNTTNKKIIYKSEDITIATVDENGVVTPTDKIGDTFIDIRCGNALSKLKVSVVKGVEGVAIATLISNILSAALVLIHLYRREDEFQFRFHQMRIEKNNLKKILIIGVPAGIQGAIFSVSNVFIQSGINSFGENAIAGSSLALNFEYFTYDIAVAFAQAAVTFTGQNYGAGNLKRCKKIFWECMLFGIGFTQILCIIFMIWDDFFVGIYTTSTAVAAFGLSRLHHVCSLEGLTATYEVESAALRGMGKSLEPSIITVLGTVVFRVIWLLTVFKMVPTYEMLMNVYVASWIFTGGLLLLIYLKHMRKLEKKAIK